jgi:hypothetical protein
VSDYNVGKNTPLTVTVEADVLTVRVGVRVLAKMRRSLRQLLHELDVDDVDDDDAETAG